MNDSLQVTGFGSRARRPPWPSLPLKRIVLEGLSDSENLLLVKRRPSCEYLLKICSGGLNLQQTSSKRWLVACILVLSLIPTAVGQSSLAGPSAQQTIATSLASLPEADALIYISPQRILNEVAPKVMPASEITKMRAAFFDLKRAVGVDPATIDYLVIAVRFHKPAGDLSFVPPDVMAVVGGDFSFDSLFTLGQLYLQDKVRTETYGSKTIALMKVDQIATEAEKLPMLKSFVEIGAVPLSATSLAIGNLRYLKSAVDAADGNGRISAAALASLMRDPSALVSASGSPLASFAKSFGLLGTDTTPRDARCETRFGDFYAAVTTVGINFSLRGAMNTDNPDTAKILRGLLLGLMEQGISSVPDMNAQTVLKSIRMTPKENEIVLEADIPEQTVANFIREQMKPKPEATTPKTPRQRVKKRRARRK